MKKVGLIVTLQARPGREDELAALLVSGRELVANEPATQTWFAFRTGKEAFGIVDTFPDAAGRSAHLAGKLASALMVKAPELLVAAPTISEVELIAEKLGA